MERCLFEIKSGTGDRVYTCPGTYEEDDKFIVMNWTEKGEDSDKVVFEVSCDKSTGRTVSRRKGNVAAVLAFEPGSETATVYKTPFGDIDMVIKTHYVNLPTLMSPALEISYEIDGQKNLFSVKRLLQNSKN
ncbi:MAG: DUF1934 domain-containing protein [Clostridiales bacterium]|nr:DUF1934 domain-containing protein [Clostridiales bacterium]MBO4580653.1 DUF1934 domain-containing protein [Clostridiales bacterium]